MKVSDYADAWLAAKVEHRHALLFNAETAALAYVADRAMAELLAEIARLKAELDGYQGRAVLHCTEAQLDTAAMDSLDAPDGTILRATDTGRELVMHDGAWFAR